jgi:hypothetical protein
MKRTKLFLTFLLFAGFSSLVQAQTGINYQGLARRASGAPVAEQNIKIKLSIRDASVSGTVVYTETRSTATNKFGLFNLVIGSTGAASQNGTLAGVNWASGAKFLQVELDPDGGNNFVDMGTTQLQAVPYALFASAATPGGTAAGDLSGTYPNPAVAKLQGKAVSATAPTANQILKYNGTAWAPANEGGLSLGAVASSATANAASITNGVLSLAPADATNAGIVTTGTQNFAGAKTFTNDLVVNSVKIGLGVGNNDQNTAIGNGALGTGTGTRNTAVGYGSLRNYSGTSFDNNTSVGYWNFPSLTTGQQNTSIGAEAMLALQTGNANTAIGAQTLLNTTGNNNTAIGYRAGETLVAGNNNTLLGFGANLGSPNLNNATAIGASATVTTDNTIQLGNSAINDVKTTGKLTTGAVTYPNTDGASGQALITNGSGTASWLSPGGDLSGTYSNPAVAKIQGKAVSATAPTANQILKFDGTAWAPANEGSLSVGAVAATPTTNAASITNGVLNLAPADATNAGIVTTGTQTFAGDKTFSSGLTVTTKPFLPTKLTANQISALTTVEEGMVVYNTTQQKLQVYAKQEGTDPINETFVGTYTNGADYIFQSFVSPVSGTVTSIELYTADLSNGSMGGGPFGAYISLKMGKTDAEAQMNMSSGTWFSGMGMSSQLTSAPQWVTVTLSTPLSVVGGGSYGFRVNASSLCSGGMMGMSGHVLAVNNSYPNGSAYFDNTPGASSCGSNIINGDDLLFKVHITPNAGSINAPSLNWINLH